MPRWLILVAGLASLIGILIGAYAMWAHEMYTVGMDLNLKAIVVAGVVVVIVGALTAIAQVLVRRRRSRRD